MGNGNTAISLTLWSVFVFAASGCGADMNQGQFGAAERGADPQAAARILAQPGVTASERKIIHTGQLNLAVKALDDAEREINRLLTEAGGQIAEFREERTTGDRRAGRWKVRVPPAKFAEFVDSVAELGVPELRAVQAADVTEEYIDVEARLKNKRQLETRILKLLEEKTGEIRDVVAVETELARIREEIERIEGRLRFLASQVELSTVAIYAFEKQEYEPPSAPKLGDRIAASFYGSIQVMTQLGEQLVLLFVCLAPWAALALIVGCGSWLVFKVIWWTVRPRASS